MRTFVICLLVLCPFSAKAAYTLKDGHFVNVDELATLPPKEHFRLGIEALNARNWEEAAKQFNIVAINFPNTPPGQEAFFYNGIANFQMQEYDIANTAFTNYLKNQTNPKFFQDAVEYKFSIAERFRMGACRHFWETKQLPKWASGKSLALEIYDEVISALPNHDLGAKALYAKASLLWEMRQYRESIETYQRIPKRFPKNELAPDSYVMVNRVYLEQSKREFQNPDLLALAELNLKRFQEDFPTDERLTAAKQDLLALKEVYAKGLYDIGEFYERIYKPEASVLYYVKALHDFPETRTAHMCRQRLQKLCPSTLASNDETP
jgi:outer membrane protein assembly factor BamD (BamD/ComL family)